MLLVVLEARPCEPHHLRPGGSSLLPLLSHPRSHLLHLSPDLFPLLFPQLPEDVAHLLLDRRVCAEDDGTASGGPTDGGTVANLKEFEGEAEDVGELRGDAGLVGETGESEEPSVCNE